MFPLYPGASILLVEETGSTDFPLSQWQTYLIVYGGIETPRHRLDSQGILLCIILYLTYKKKISKKTWEMFLTSWF